MNILRGFRRSPAQVPDRTAPKRPLGLLGPQPYCLSSKTLPYLKATMAQRLEARSLFLKRPSLGHLGGLCVWALVGLYAMPALYALSALSNLSSLFSLRRAALLGGGGHKRSAWGTAQPLQQP